MKPKLEREIDEKAEQFLNDLEGDQLKGLPLTDYAEAMAIIESQVRGRRKAAEIDIRHGRGQ